jgi:DNA ligase D-like protein (predicted polymerase)
MATPSVEIEVDGKALRISNPDKVFFPEIGLTKLDLVNYYVAVGAGALRGVSARPTVMKRFPDGASGDFFFQKRVPENRPEWLRTVTVAFPSGRTATELCPADVAHIIWAVNLGCIDLNPWPVRRWDTEHPDELRVDLDPQPGVPWRSVQAVAQCVREVLTEHGLVGFPKTSGSRGIHINIRILPRWDFTEVRRAALALAREVERRLPDTATSKWWKEERGTRVFIDYNQNARDRTVASAYSVRPVPDARVSAPIGWDELDHVTLADFTVATMPARYATLGDLHEPLDTNIGVLDQLLALAHRDEAEGLGDAPWPPHFRRQDSEARRVAPSRAARAKPAASANRQEPGDGDAEV